MVDLAGHEHVPGFHGALLDGTAIVGRGGPGGWLKYLAEMENQAQGEVSERQYNARRFRTVDVQDLFEDQRRLPVRRSWLPGPACTGARGWTRRAYPRTPRWSEPPRGRGWGRASASERARAGACTAPPLPGRPSHRRRAISARGPSFSPPFSKTNFTKYKLRLHYNTKFSGVRVRGRDFNSEKCAVGARGRYVVGAWFSERLGI